MTWTEQPERADADARQTPRDPRCPPHWLRCAHYLGGERCMRGSGHGGDHAPLPATK